jgi:hypothetical protein
MLYDGIALCDQAKAKLQVLFLSATHVAALFVNVLQALADDCALENARLLQQLRQLREELISAAKLSA